MPQEQNLPAVQQPSQVMQEQPQIENSKQYFEFSSIDTATATQAEKVSLFNAMKHCDALVKDHIGEVVELKNIYIKTFYSNKDNKDKVRVVLFLTDGTTLVSGSYGLMHSIVQLLRTFGEPKTWSEPMKIKLTTNKTPNGESYSIEIVE